MAIVYLTQEPGVTYRPAAGGGREAVSKDLSSAQRYGTLQTVLPDGTRPSYAPGPTLMKLAKGLRNFREEDFLCAPGGDPLGLALALLALRYNGVREVQYLRWERERSIDGARQAGAGYYVPVRLSLTP